MTVGLDVATLALRGLHLIEASAGTGKTFTIALLYLRLLLERDAGLRGIAVVTFTEAATRELRQRLRLRVGDALRSLRGKPSTDAALESVLAVHRDDSERQRLALERLEAALTGFDEAFVATIHGFCRQLLAETAFESGLPFIELDTDANGEAVQELVRDFWRLHVVAAADEGARTAVERWREPDVLARELVQSQALALDAAAIDPVDAGGWRERAQRAFAVALRDWKACVKDGRAVRALKELREAAQEKRVSIAKDGHHNADALDRCEAAISAPTPDHAQLRPLHLACLREAIARATRKGWSPGVELLAVAGIVETLLDANDEVVRARHAAFLVDALTWVRSGLAARRERLRHFGFDDLIGVLHERLHGADGAALARTIAQRLPALLFDEFQDTDPQQYAILRSLHGGREDGVMFLIGDPKQAIYRFRGGDVFTFRAAAKDAGAHVHTLVDNWRSDPRLIKAVNAVFAKTADAFLHDFIRFEPAQFPRTKNRDRKAEAGKPLVVWRLPDAVDAKGRTLPWTTDAFAERVLAETALQIRKRLVAAHEAGRRLSVAVLVNTNRQAAAAAETLARWNIACDYLGTDSVYESAEAEELAHVLAALAAPGAAATARMALATELFGESLADLLSARADPDLWERQLARLATMRLRWQEAGPFAALAMAIQQAAPRLLGRWDGRRRVTNWLHLAEELQHAAAQRESAEEMQRWLARCRREAAERRGYGAREQVRPADDPGEVQVLTIHRSKGLEFDLVFAPFLARTNWAEPRSEPDKPVAWHGDSGRRIDVGGPDWHAHALLHREEQFAESLRLTYVALTRARHEAYTAWAWVRTGTAKSQTSLVGPLAWLILRDGKMKAPEELADIPPAGVDAALEALAARARGGIRIEPLAATLPPVDAAPTPAAPTPLAAAVFHGAIDRRPETLSYSRLFGGSVHAPVADHDEGERVDAAAVAGSGEDIDSEAIAIPQWPRGAAFGNCVHEILEKIPFSALAAADPPSGLLRIAREHRYDAAETRVIAAMVRATVTSTLPGPSGGFTLAALAPGEVLSELEFLFPLPGARLAALEAILADHPRHARPPGELARRRHEVAGLMTGYIDLVLRHDGRYHVIDYKTNLLGASAADYAPSQLAAAVRARDYDLQYLIYLVALQRFLRVRLGDDYDYDRHVGGALYLFVRGLGSGEDHGIHVDRPPRTLIDALDAWCAGGPP